MAYKVFLDPGHGGTDPGAVKYIREETVNLNMALACRDYLKANGVDVKMSRSTDKNTTSSGIVNACNSYKPDLAVSIHNNAGGGNGCEVYYTIKGGAGKKLAKNINSEFKNIGQNSRGVKTRKGSRGDYYFFIREIKCPAVITEAVFVDNKADAAQADTLAEQKAFGVAIAKGILKTLGVADNGGTSAATQFKVKVTASALNIRAGAGTKHKKVGQIKDKGVYTIIEVFGNWGKLKSSTAKSPRWIHLGYTKKL